MIKTVYHQTVHYFQQCHIILSLSLLGEQQVYQLTLPTSS